VTDIDIVRGFNRFTGQPVGTIDFSAFAPVQLNDIATGPDGMRVTDTGIHMVYEGNVHTGPDRVFSVSGGRQVQVVIEAPDLHLPNGITWDPQGKRWIVVAFDRHAGEVWVLPRTGDTTRIVLRRGKGQLDGVEVLPDGRLLFSSWADSAIHVLEGTRDTPLIRQMHEPADIGVDTRRGRVLIPLAIVGHVQIWDLGNADR
jgi:sugar lactone lactonase YvrE